MNITWRDRLRWWWLDKKLAYADLLDRMKNELR